MSCRAAVVGLGAMGRHHARLLHDLEGVELVATCDVDLARAREHARGEGCLPVETPAALPDDLDAVVVATPTTTHGEIAEPLLRAGVSCLVEKPLAASLEEADALGRAAEAGGAVLFVGHAERFNPGLDRVRELVRDPIFVESHRLGVFPERSLDVDVVLDLMIHDLDLLHWLTDSEPTTVEAIGVDVLTRRVDIANARVTYGSGCTANLTASRVSAEITRKMRVFAENRYVSVDFVEQSAEVVELRPSQGRPQMERRRVTGGEQRGEPLRFELEAFLKSVRGECPPAVGFHDGRRALAAALAVLAGMDAQKRRRDVLRQGRGGRRSAPP